MKFLCILLILVVPSTAKAVSLEGGESREARELPERMRSEPKAPAEPRDWTISAEGGSAGSGGHG
jgi:hypothetical protein